MDVDVSAVGGAGGGGVDVSGAAGGVDAGGAGAAGGAGGGFDYNNIMNMAGKYGQFAGQGGSGEGTEEDEKKKKRQADPSLADDAGVATDIAALESGSNGFSQLTNQQKDSYSQYIGATKAINQLELPTFETPKSTDRSQQRSAQPTSEDVAAIKNYIQAAEAAQSAKAAQDTQGVQQTRGAQSTEVAPQTPEYHPAER